MRKFGLLIRPLLRLRIGHEAVILLIRIPRRRGIAVKIYRRTEATKWLSQNLSEKQVTNRKVHPIALREYSILKRLENLDIAPKPIRASRFFLIMTDEGESLKGRREASIKSLQPQADNLYLRLKDAQIEHNDVKLDNLVVSHTGALKIIDFTFSSDPEIRIKELGPSPAWGRFDSDDALLDLINLSKNS